MVMRIGRVNSHPIAAVHLRSQIAQNQVLVQNLPHQQVVRVRGPIDRPHTQVPQRRGTTSDDRRTRPMPACLRCDERRDVLRRTRDRPRPVGKASNDAMRPPQRTPCPALHCTPLTAAGSQCCTIPCWLVHCVPGQDVGAEGIEGQASVSPPPHARTCRSMPASTHDARPSPDDARTPAKATGET